MRFSFFLFLLPFCSLGLGKTFELSDLPEHVPADPHGHYVLVRCHLYGTEQKGVEEVLRADKRPTEKGRNSRPYMEVYVISTTEGCPVEAKAYYRLYGIPRGTIPKNDRFYAQLLLSKGPTPILWKGFWRTSVEGKYRKTATTRTIAWSTSYTPTIAVSPAAPVRRAD
jgi:hypothetical protein